MNDPKSGAVFVVGFMALAVAWRVWETFQKQGVERGQTSMRWSFYALFGLSCLIFTGTLLEFFLLSRPWRPGIAAVGVVLFVLANVLRIVAIRTLGRFWSLHIEIRSEQPLIREGPYRFVRHPAYVAFILESVGVALVGNAWWSLAVTVLLYVPMIRWRIAREERALTGKFGDRYREYRREVGALLPRWPASRPVRESR